MRYDQQAEMDQEQKEYYARQNTTAAEVHRYCQQHNLPLETVMGHRRGYKPKMFWTPWVKFWFVLPWVLIVAGIFLATVPL